MREKLFRLLGKLPPIDRHIEASLVGVEDHSNYKVERLILNLNGIEEVPAVFVKPKGRIKKFPVVLFCHSHGNNYECGKSELIRGNDKYLCKPDYAATLSSIGYASLCIDLWGFGERRGRTESEIFKLMLWNGQVMWGMMVYDTIKAVDYLHSREDIDPNYIVTLGFSMGSTLAWWVAALDTRITACVDICCLTDFHTLIKNRGLDLHGVYYYVPGLLDYFTTAKINSLIAPRPHLSLAGNYDPITPQEGLEIIDEELKEAYRDSPASWELARFDTGHYETYQMRMKVRHFLETLLKASLDYSCSGNR